MGQRHWGDLHPLVICVLAREAEFSLPGPHQPQPQWPPHKLLLLQVKGLGSSMGPRGWGASPGTAGWWAAGWVPMLPGAGVGSAVRVPGCCCLWTQWSPGPFSLRCSVMLAVEKSQIRKRGELKLMAQGGAQMPSGHAVGGKGSGWAERALSPGRVWECV